MKKFCIYLISFLYCIITIFAGHNPVVNADEISNQEKEVIIVYKNKTGKNEILKESNKVEYEFKTVQAVSVIATEDDLKKLESNPNIDHIEENIPFSIHETGQVKVFQSSQNVPTGETQWNINATNVQNAWNKGFLGTGVKVGVIDTGIANHNELHITGGASTVDYTNSWQDDNGHGTHVSGIIATQPGIASVNGLDITGVAPGVNLYAIKALDSSGTGNLQDILEGIDWAISNEMDIINLSFGSPEYSQLFEQMINKAYDKGILIVAASGNDGLENSVNYPAKFNNVIAVSSVNESLTKSRFSSTGNEVDFSAPGEDIISTFTQGKYAIESGTSQATPHVTGMLALLKEKYPNFTNGQLKDLLVENTKDLGVAGQDPYYGFGLIYFNSNVSDTVPSVNYSSNVETYGWTDFVSDSEISGTVGQAKRLEAVKIKLENNTYSGDIFYSTHVQDYGWLNDVSNGEISGTVGQSKRMEAIKIKLTGEMAEHYDVYYRVHSQDYGWLDWAKNGGPAGTQGLAKRIEAIQIVLTNKDGEPPGPTNRPFVFPTTSIVYLTHVQDYGWLNPVFNGQLSGTTGKNKRVEAIQISLRNAIYSGGISYTTHVQDYGWLAPVSDGKTSGKTGESKRVEAIQINLTGEMANHYDVYYRVHVQDYGWLGWAKDGDSAGTQGLSKRVEAIEIILIEKGGKAPGLIDMPFIKNPSV